MYKDGDGNPHFNSDGGFMKYSPKQMNELLENNEFNLKKKFGQNFIVDENLIDSIVNKSNIDDETLVIEIGPGAGSLTYKLAKKAKNVLCYEVDKTLKPILNETLKEFGNVEIVFNDFLKTDILTDLKKYKYKRLYVVANLPYYITTPILVKIIEDNLGVDKIVVMVQKEVGNRFKAQPNTKDYSSLSVYLNYYYDVKKILDVSKNVFLPKPNVDSIVVEFNKKGQKDLKNKDLFFKLVKDSFKQKRKNLKNNLKSYDLNKIEEVLKKYDLDLTARAEQLKIEIFEEISNNL